MPRLENGQRDPEEVVRFNLTAEDGYVEQIALYGGWMLYALTPCCKASVKGMDTYIGCRACYQEIGDAWYLMAFDLRKQEERQDAYRWLLERSKSNGGKVFDEVAKARHVS